MQSSGKVVLFDIDYTLFDTSRFRDKLYEELSSLPGISGATVEEIGTRAYQNVRKELGYFNPEEFIQELSKGLNGIVSAEDIKRSIWSEGKFKECLYDETIPVLIALEKVATIGIFSKGHDLFQRSKLNQIAHFFDEQHIHIAVNKDIMFEKVLKKYQGEKLFLVDDALDILHKAKNLREDIVTVWVKRGIFAAVQKPIPGFEPNVTVENLRGIEKIIDRN